MPVESCRDIRPVLHQRQLADAEYREDLGRSKRYLERYVADPEFRSAAAVDSRAAAARWGLDVDPEEIRPLWDPKRASEPGSLSVGRFRAFTRERLAASAALRRRGAFADPDWRAWRERQMQRCISHLGPKADLLVHAPFCIELGKGCSVGCWFCAVSAAKLGEQLTYTPAHKSWWRNCLEVLQEILGPAAAAGYCYWGNDPLDNPDYESFLVDFHEVLGVFPQTTTAQPDRHVDRVKALLREAEKRGGLLERFSVLTLGQWKRIHEAFSASEMAFVECVPQNKEALDAYKVVAGRALEREQKQVAAGKAQPTPADSTSTIACVSGFYLNMVDRRVQLITPCNASRRWPLGYQVLNQGQFEDARSLRSLLLRLGEESMRSTLRAADPFRFRDDLQVEAAGRALSLHNRYRSDQVVLPRAMQGLTRSLIEGQMTVGELALACEQPLEETFHFLNTMVFERGFLEEESELVEVR